MNAKQTQKFVSALKTLCWLLILSACLKLFYYIFVYFTVHKRSEPQLGSIIHRAEQTLPLSQSPTQTTIELRLDPTQKNTYKLPLEAGHIYEFILNLEAINLDKHTHYLLPEVLPGPAMFWVDWLECPCLIPLPELQQLRLKLAVKEELPEPLGTIDLNFPLYRAL